MSADLRKSSAGKDGKPDASVDRARSERRSAQHAHDHLTAFTASIALDGVSGKRAESIRRNAAACTFCSAALERFEAWLDVLQHQQPRVAPEFVTRYHLLAELFDTAETQQGRLLLLESDDLYHHWGLCTLLVEEARKYRYLRPSLAFDFAELAQLIAKKLDPCFYGDAEVAVMRARCAACMGFCSIALERLDLAEQQLVDAQAWVRLASAPGTLPSDLGKLSELLGEIRDMRKRRPASPQDDSKSAH